MDAAIESLQGRLELGGAGVPDCDALVQPVVTDRTSAGTRNLLQARAMPQSRSACQPGGMT
jgi:hypothetical protein